MVKAWESVAHANKASIAAISQKQRAKAAKHRLRFMILACSTSKAPLTHADMRGRWNPKPQNACLRCPSGAVRALCVVNSFIIRVRSFFFLVTESH